MFNIPDQKLTTYEVNCSDLRIVNLTCGHSLCFNIITTGPRTRELLPWYHGKCAHSNAAKEARLYKLTLEKWNSLKARLTSQCPSSYLSGRSVMWTCPRWLALLCSCSSDKLTTLLETVRKPLTADWAIFSAITVCLLYKLGVKEQSWLKELRQSSLKWVDLEAARRTFYRDNQRPSATKCWC